MWRIIFKHLSKFEFEAPNYVSMFSLFLQLKKWTETAEEPINLDHFRSRDIPPHWLVYVYYCEQEISTRTRLKHDIIRWNAMFGYFWLYLVSFQAKY